MSTIDPILFAWVKEQAAILRMPYVEVLNRCVKQVREDGLRDTKSTARLRYAARSHRGRRTRNAT